MRTTSPGPARTTGSTERYAVGAAFRLPVPPGRALQARRLTTTYFDTPDLRLAHADVALRHRREARRAAWQLTLPRGVVEVPAEPRAASPPARFRDALALHLRGRRLFARATVRARRTAWRVRDRRGAVADVVADRGTLVARGAVRPVHAVEVTWRRADDEARAALTKALGAAGARGVDTRPELLAVLGLPGSARPPAPPAHASPAALAAAAVRAQLDRIRAHDPGTRLGEDPEDLHEMRTATRRLRAYLRLLAPMLPARRSATAAAELAWLADTLGAVRDVDVFLAYLRREAATLAPADRRGVTPLVAALVEDRARARAALLDALGRPRYRALLARLEAMARPPRRAAELDLAALPVRAFRKLKRAVRALDDPPADAALHAVRIRGKRARHAAELAEPVIGARARRFVRTARAFQDVLGEYQDATVAEERLRQLVRRVGSPEAGLVIGELVERQRLRRQAALAAFPAAWRRLRRRGKRLSA